MKRIKPIVLASTAILAALACLGAASASATTLTKEGVKMLAGETLDFSAHASLHWKTGGGTTIKTCSGGTIVWKIANAGGVDGDGKDIPVSGPIETLSWSGCSDTVHTLAKGTLQIHGIAGTNHGTVTSSGMRVTTRFLGVSCILETKNTDIGILTEGKPATLDINGTLPKVSGFPCPSHDVWTGAYITTNPSGTLAVDAG